MEEAAQSKKSLEHLKPQPLNSGLITRFTYSNKNWMQGAGQTVTLWESQLGPTRLGY